MGTSRTPWRSWALTVYRRAGEDCSSGGITSSAHKLSLVGVLRHDLGDSVEPVPSRIQPEGVRHPVILAGRDGDAYLAPAVLEEGQWTVDCTSFWVDGGNFAHGSGPEWAVVVASFRIPSTVAVRVHDRCRSDPWEV